MIPRLGFGTGSIGNLSESVPERRARETLESATAAGISYFDTAPLYGHGLAELRLGQHLRSLPRGSYHLSTKVGLSAEPTFMAKFEKGGWADPLPFALRVDYSRDGIHRSLEQSFLRLGVDRFDTVLVHDIDRRNRGADFDRQLKIVLEEALPVLHDLKRAGVIGAVGIGINEADVACQIMEAAEIDVLMLAGRLSIMKSADGQTALAVAAQRGVAVIAASVFNSGLLARPEDATATFDYRAPNPDERARIALLQARCAEFEVPIQAAALQYPARFAAVASVVVGTSQPQRIVQNVAWAEWPIPPAFWDAI